jgi:hypothetical protein
MAGGKRLISWLHPCSTSNVALYTGTCAHGPLMGHPNWVVCEIPPPPPKPALMGHSWVIQIGSGVTFTPLKEPDVLVGPTHLSSVDPYTMSCVPS